MTVTISERSVTKLVAAATSTVPGVASLSTGMGRITGRTFPRFDVQLDPDGDTATIEVIIAVTWPSPVASVAEAVRDTIIEHLRILAGVKVLSCNVMVGPVVASENRVTRSDLVMPTIAPLPITVGAR